MAKKDLIVKVAEKFTTDEKKMSQRAAGEIVDAVLDTIVETLVTGEDVKITGFGTFSVVDRPEREGRNPMTGETIQIAASKAPKFKAAKALKDAVNA